MADESKKSFIENVNTIANATQLATGDVIEDANRAKNAAEVAAGESEASAVDSYNSEEMAEDWATKSYNSIVEGSTEAGTDRYSAYHWSEVARLNAGSNAINDTYISTEYTWSSDKINSLTAGKADEDHNHDGIYEPVIAKNTAFNRNFFTGTNAGAALTVSRGDHLHNGIYELYFTKSSAFNKDFGTISGSVSQGDHNHASEYMPLATQNSAYNKPFVVDTQSPGSEEISRGNHYHTAQGTTYDPSNNKIATSLNVQGSISQLDGIVGNITFIEKTKVIAGLGDGAIENIAIAFADTPVVIDANLVQNYEKNALYNNNGIEISYNNLVPVDKPGSPEQNLIEGDFHVSLTIEGEADVEYTIAPAVYDGVTWVELLDYKIIAGGVGNPAGSIPLSFSAFVSNLYDKNAVDRGEGDYYKIGVHLYSSVTNTVNISAMVMSWAGNGEGSIVSSGISMDHADLTGLGAGTSHSTSDISGLDTSLLSKAEKIIPATVDNIAILDATGNLKDSGILIGEFSNKMNLVGSPVLDNFITMDSAGNSKESGMNANTFALTAGNALQAFEVDNAADGTKQAVNKIQVETVMAGVVYLTDANMDAYSDRPDLDGYITHVEATNPHNVTAAQTGAALTVHTHVESDVTGLTDSLNGKYDIVATAAQGHIPTFGLTGELEDSLIATTKITTNANSSPMDEWVVPSVNENGDLVPSTLIIQNPAVSDHYAVDFLSNSANSCHYKVKIKESSLGMRYENADIGFSSFAVGSFPTKWFLTADRDEMIAGNLDLQSEFDTLSLNTKKVVVEDAYATDTIGGTIKLKVVGTDCYITTDGSTPGV